MVSILVPSAGCLLWTVAQLLRVAAAAGQQIDGAAAANADEAAQALQALEEATKRAGFLPMRGRRGPDEVPADDKRASSSFMPMRGRKDFPEDGEDMTDKRASAFLPSRGRKDDPFLEDLEDKRASSFMPMRGRKDDGSFKRLSSFMPMRGRKSTVYNPLSYPAFSELRGRKKAYGSKRLNSAFMPMRGKKDDFEQDEDLDDELRDEDKRGQSGSFFGMRGKRQAPTSKVATKREALFFATRGKRTAA